MNIDFNQLVNDIKAFKYFLNCKLFDVMIIKTDNDL